MSNPSKDLRKQLRNELKSMADELVTLEIVEKAFKVLTARIDARLDAIDQRQKDLQGYMVRQSSPAVKSDV